MSILSNVRRLLIKVLNKAQKELRIPKVQVFLRIGLENLPIHNVNLIMMMMPCVICLD